mgnify:CR=1 FL=1
MWFIVNLRHAPHCTCAVGRNVCCDWDHQVRGSYNFVSNSASARCDCFVSVLFCLLLLPQVMYIRSQTDDVRRIAYDDVPACRCDSEVKYGNDLTRLHNSRQASRLMFWKETKKKAY